MTPLLIPALIVLALLVAGIVFVLSAESKDPPRQESETPGELSDYTIGYQDGWQMGLALRWDGQPGDDRDREYRRGLNQGWDDVWYIDTFWLGYVDGLGDGELGRPHRVRPLYDGGSQDEAFWDGYSTGWIKAYDSRERKS